MNGGGEMGEECVQVACTAVVLLHMARVARSASGTDALPSRRRTALPVNSTSSALQPKPSAASAQSCALSWAQARSTALPVT